MNNVEQDIVVKGLFEQLISFWKFLFSKITLVQFLVSSGMLLIAGVLEGVSLFLLLPLLSSIESDNKQRLAFSFLEYVNIKPSFEYILAFVMTLMIAKAIFIKEQEILNTRFRLNLTRENRLQLFSAIAHAKWSLSRRIKPAEYLSALTSEADRLDQAFDFALAIPTRIVMILVYISVAYIISPILSLVAIIGSILIFGLVYNRFVESMRLGQSLTKLNTEFYKSASEFLGGLKIIKIFNAQNQSVKSFTKILNFVASDLMRFARSRTNARLLLDILLIIAISAFLFVSTKYLKMALAEVLVLSLIFYRLLPQVQSLIYSAQNLLHASSAANTIQSLIQQSLLESEQPILGSDKRLNGNYDIEIKGVSYHYPEQKHEILKNVNMTLKNGTLTVISGVSGAGKTTLLDILAGLLMPTEGEILINGRRLDDSLVQTWRNSIAYVSQESTFFDDTIRANLLMAKNHATEQEMRQALMLSGAEEFVRKLPENIDTIVGDRGHRFSGGERQRLALARAMLRNPILLILDEVTNALDIDNEQLVLGSIYRIKAYTKVLLVTHKPDRIHCKDQYLRLAEGRLKEIRSIKS